MAAHLLIDGYNFFKQSALAALSGAADLETGRRYLLDELWRYKKEKNLRITVVFDGTHGSSPGRKKETYKGVEVVYSKQGETADEVMMETIRARQAGPPSSSPPTGPSSTRRKSTLSRSSRPQNWKRPWQAGRTTRKTNAERRKRATPARRRKGIRRARRAMKKI